MDTWIIIYRAYTLAKLQEEFEWLQTQSRNLYTSQTEGNRAYTRATRDIAERLGAATQVLTERTGQAPSRTMQIDFSRILE